MSKFIDVDAFAEKIESIAHDPKAVNSDAIKAVELVAGIARDFPTADVAPVIHAHWTFHISECNRTHWNECSHCHQTISYIHGFPYCPWCGSKMDEVTK